MRFNKQELISLASFPSNKFTKEGILHITEKQEGIFRRSEVNFARWCKLHGNLLFYLKDIDQFSTPLGVLVLENCQPVIRSEKREIDGYPFYIEFKDGSCQRISANTESERTEWFQAINMASYARLNKQVKLIQEQIAKKLGAIPQASVDLKVADEDTKEIDITELPLCESFISCDNLLCDAHGRPPNTSVIVQIQKDTSSKWITYGKTEVIERCSNPQFLCTVIFYPNSGLNTSSIIRFSVYDVREKISRTSVPIGFAEIALGVIQDTTRLRIPLRSVNGNSGFITIVSWVPEHDKKTLRSPAKAMEQQSIGHRRSQSLPPKLGVKLFVPYQGKLCLLFTNPTVHTYRLQSGLGGDISVQEMMLESKLNYLIPQQLLSIWILREKELLQEISGMGELGGEWRSRQMDLLDKHLKLLKDYSQAKQNLQQFNCNNNKFFKRSSMKSDESLEFVPVNLHLQRMCAYNDTLKRCGVLDIMTVGAFTRHAGKNKTGGLIKLLQQTKDSPSKIDQNGCKVQAANDAVQAIKQLRREIVEIMSQLLCLAKMKNPKGMLSLCNDMVNKTRTLLNLWEPNLVEEAFGFIEKHRIIEEPDNTRMPMSPFKKITQQLGELDLKSPELEDFTTPVGASPDLWPKLKSISAKTYTKSQVFSGKSPSAADISTISTIQNSVKMYHNEIRLKETTGEQPTNPTIVQPINRKSEDVHDNNDEGILVFSETHFDINGDISTSNSTTTSLTIIPSNCEIIKPNDDAEEIGIEYLDEIKQSKNEILHNFADIDENGYIPTNCSIILGHNGAFLDTNVMSSSPSANYYRPTEEPEPLDLTQLNIEASVMCLVSKVKFLCGRCGSPAVRLRQPCNSIKRGFVNSSPDVVTSQPIKRNNSLSLPENNSDVANANFDINNQNDDMQQRKIGNINGKDLNLALTQAVGEVTRKVKKGNKFTDGLDLSLTTDWASELRPSMRKLRQAMDGLLKTARLMHSVQRLQQDMKKTSANLTTMYRRDVCFSQALTSLVSGLMARIWGTVITESYIKILSQLGVLAYFEGLLSLYGNETDMWGDMCIAIEDLSAVTFTLTRSNIQRESKTLPVPRVIGSRQSLTVLIPVPEQVYGIFPPKENITFKVIPVFFNIGINEKATLSETLGYTREQHRSNWDNFDRLKQYHIRYKKLNVNNSDNNFKNDNNAATSKVADHLNKMEEFLRANTSKNVKILHLAEDICRLVNGLRFTSCKSAKDRTGMAVTLEQCRILQQDFHLPANNIQNVLNTMRSEGTRADNVVKNIGERKYAFNLPQVLSLPGIYRPPAGTYGKAQT